MIELIENGHDVIIADNLINSKIEVLDKLEGIVGRRPDFYQIDVTDERQVERLFKAYDIDGVIHFAGLKAVGESVSMPDVYYMNNIVSTLTLSRMCLKYGVTKFVFSSSATVYGEQASPLSESMEMKRTTNPYGETKAMSERILSDIAGANPGFAVSLLRYFNPVGAHKSGLLGEDPNGVPNNLMPYVTRVAKGHVKALENIKHGVSIHNLGTGKGTSVFELVNAFMEVNEVDVPYEIVGRRPGDVAVCYADPTKAEQELGWKAELTLEDMVRDAWRFESGGSSLLTHFVRWTLNLG